ncbi:hypothetical protein BDW02DRAFT_34920 [Decorospora gaudefroyi]|uniref:Uncharacterized protein n=1 Tax=Decorospora gaudefroyi TaxID=184978 RepID=A0A6A5KQ25_9PLEO|nr:hypothetical protein BDW02DRAFT_34920 [Decorospora gaudefroyi]
MFCTCGGVPLAPSGLAFSKTPGTPACLGLTASTSVYICQKLDITMGYLYSAPRTCGNYQLCGGWRSWCEIIPYISLSPRLSVDGRRDLMLSRSFCSFQYFSAPSLGNIQYIQWIDRYGHVTRELTNVDGPAANSLFGISIPIGAFALSICGNYARLFWTSRLYGLRWVGRYTCRIYVSECVPAPYDALHC